MMSSSTQHHQSAEERNSEFYFFSNCSRKVTSTSGTRKNNTMLCRNLSSSSSSSSLGKFNLILLVLCLELINIAHGSSNNSIIKSSSSSLQNDDANKFANALKSNIDGGSRPFIDTAIAKALLADDSINSKSLLSSLDAESLLTDPSSSSALWAKQAATIPQNNFHFSTLADGDRHSPSTSSNNILEQLKLIQALQAVASADADSAAAAATQPLYIAPGFGQRYFDFDKRAAVSFAEQVAAAGGANSVDRAASSAQPIQLEPGFGQRYFDFDKRASPFYAMRGKKAAFYAMRGKRSVEDDDSSPSLSVNKRTPMSTWLSNVFAPRNAYERMYQNERNWYTPHFTHANAASPAAFVDADQYAGAGNARSSGGGGGGADESADAAGYATPQQYKRAMFFAMRG